VHVYARESNDDARTFNGLTVHSTELHIFTREVEDMLKVISDTNLFHVSATAPDVTHEAVDIEQASRGKVIVEYSAGTTCKSSGRECEDNRQHTQDAK